jgi:hypothetical protein
MAVEGQHAVAMIDGNQVSVPLVGTGIIYCPRLYREYRRSFGNRNIIAPVIDHPATAERVETPANAGGNPPAIHGHVALRKTYRRKQKQEKK